MIKTPELRLQIPRSKLQLDCDLSFVQLMDDKNLFIAFRMMKCVELINCTFMMTDRGRGAKEEVGLGQITKLNGNIFRETGHLFSGCLINSEKWQKCNKPNSHLPFKRLLALAAAATDAPFVLQSCHRDAATSSLIISRTVSQSCLVSN